MRFWALDLWWMAILFIVQKFTLLRFVTRWKHFSFVFHCFISNNNIYLCPANIVRRSSLSTECKNGNATCSLQASICISRIHFNYFHWSLVESQYLVIRFTANLFCWMMWLILWAINCLLSSLQSFMEIDGQKILCRWYL